MIGPTIPIPAPASLVEAISSIEVTNTDEGRDGFQIIFSIGKSSNNQTLTEGINDFSLINNPLLKPFNRVIIMVTFGAVPRVLIDGIITHQQFNPSQEPGQSSLTIIGEDISVMMDMKEISTTHPNQPDIAIVSKIIASYAQYGLVPMIIPPKSMDVPVMVTRIPSQQSTDLQYILELANTYDFIFYIEPTRAPLVNIAYWGPRNLIGIPQRALTVNMGAETNVTYISFQNNSLNATLVIGSVQDPILGIKIPVITTGSMRPPLAVFPAWMENLPNIRIEQFRSNGGVNALQAYSRAQSRTDRSSDAVSAIGELDSVVYGDVLHARKLVGLRGVGYMHDGFYYVKNVTHQIKKGEYKQQFTLIREGVGSTTPVVPT
jgi:hypothetical protein